MIKLRPRHAVALALTLSLTMAGCGGDDGGEDSAAEPRVSAEGAAEWDSEAPAEWEDLLAQAEEEGSVVVGGPPQLADAMSTAFKEDTGITLEWVSGNGGELSAKLQQEQAAGASSMDLKLGGPAELYIDYKNVLKPIKDQLILPSVTDSSVWREGEPDYTDPEGEYLLQGSAYVYGWPVINTDVIDPSEITQWSDLLKPEYKGKIASMDVSQPSSGQGFGLAVMQMLGDDFAEQLYVGQEVTFAAEYDQAMNWVAQGTYPILLGAIQGFVSQYQQNGVPVEPILPEDQPGYITSGFSTIVEPIDAPHPAAAQVFLNWYASARGQEVYSNVMYEASERTDVELPAEFDYVKPREGVEYWDDNADVDWLLNERSQDVETMVSFGK